MITLNIILEYLAMVAVALTAAWLIVQLKLDPDRFNDDNLAKRQACPSCNFLKYYGKCPNQSCKLFNK